MNGARRSTVHVWERSFPPTYSTILSAGGKEYPGTERQQSGPEELWKQYGHRMEEGSALEQAAGIFSFDANPAVDYEEEAFRRRMKRKKKPQKRKSRGI